MRRKKTLPTPRQITMPAQSHVKCKVRSKRFYGGNLAAEQTGTHAKQTTVADEAEFVPLLTCSDANLMLTRPQS